jgi:hypothetical protein
VPQRVFLHVGSPKTGTSFLQSVLWSQRDLAKSQGVLLPLSSVRDHYLANLDLRGITERATAPERARGMWPRLVEASLAWPDSVLISHELFAGASAAQARRAVAMFGEDAEVHIVLTARDLARQIPAEWQEHVKHRNPITFRAFVDEISGPHADRTWFWRVQDYPQVLQRWSQEVPPERTHLVTVPPAGSRPELLWQRLAGLLGLDADAFDLTHVRSNPSLGVEQTELLRRLNVELGDRLPLRGPYPGAVKERLAHRVLAHRAGTPLRLSAADRVFAVRRADTMVKELADLGVDVVGDLAELVPSADVQQVEVVDPSLLPDSTILEEGIGALISLIEQHEAERSALKEQHARRITRVRRERDRLEEQLLARSPRVTLSALADRWRWLGAVRTVYRRIRYRSS